MADDYMPLSIPGLIGMRGLPAEERLWQCFSCRGSAPFTGNNGQCPKCGARKPAVVPAVHVHHLQPDGPIWGMGGNRWKVACMPQRLQLHGMPASESAYAVTCPACMETAEYKAAARAILIEHGHIVPKAGEAGCC